MSKWSCFRTPCGSQRVSDSQKLPKSAQHYFYRILRSIWDKVGWKILLLVRYEILALFVNTLTADDRYSRHSRENILHYFQMQLSQNPKTFLKFFIEFLKSTSNFEYFELKYESLGSSISEIMDSERHGYLNL